MYENGWGVDQNYDAARQWYEKAANAGDPEGHVAAAKLYGYGRGVLRDYNTAEMHLLKAAEMGFHHAYYVLGDLHNDIYAFGHNDRYALEYYLKAAEHNAAASPRNGHLQKGKGHWFHLTTPAGVKLTRAAADNGNIYAQLNTGLRYYFGEGVRKNHLVAQTYFLMAALSGNADAQNYLAQNRVMLEPDNYDKIFVYKWFMIAAHNGNRSAEKNMMSLEADMIEIEIAEAKEAAQEWLTNN